MLSLVLSIEATIVIIFQAQSPLWTTNLAIYHSNRAQEEWPHKTHKPYSVSLDTCIKTRG